MISLKLLIIETSTRLKKLTTVVVHLKNVVVIQKFLQKKGHHVDVAYCKEDLPLKKYDIILVSYSSNYLKFNNFNAFCKINKKSCLGWIINEYKSRFNTCFYDYLGRKLNFIITNFVENLVSYKKYNKFYCLNLNTLVFSDYKRLIKKRDFIYYGTFRDNRKKYFDSFLKKDVFVSTSMRNCKKYKHIGVQPTFIKTIDWRNPVLSIFKYSIYLEDEITHNNYNHLANRFYESLSCHCVSLFHVSCLNTLKKSGIKNYQPFLFETYNELMSFKDKDFEELLIIQRQWVKDIEKEKQQVLESIEDILIIETEKNREIDV